MRLPRDVSGQELIRALARMGYEPTRQTGSHVRLTARLPAQHHLTVPLHASLRVGTLSAIVAAVAEAQSMDRDSVARQLFG